MDKNISEVYIYNAYICMYGTNFLRDTKFNNYKQHRLSDNNHNCKFFVTIFLTTLWGVGNLDCQLGRNILNKAP